MIAINYINTPSNPDSDDLHSSSKSNLTNIISNYYSKNEFDNLILNSNLDNYRKIK